MEEVKFRAWDELAKQWVYFDYIDLLSGRVSREVNTLRLIHHCRYTGLKDKNGVEIYEGDLWLLDRIIYKVEFVAGQFVATPTKRVSGAGRLPTTETALAYMPASGVVTGNIYENPELLEAKS